MDIDTRIKAIIRKLLRELASENKLSDIPYADGQQKMANKNLLLSL